MGMKMRRCRSTRECTKQVEKQTASRGKDKRRQNNDN